MGAKLSNVPKANLAQGVGGVAGGVAGAVLGAAAGALVGSSIGEAYVKGKKTAQQMSDQLMKQEYGSSSTLEVLCATMSSWVYHYGSKVVKVKDAHDNGAAAYRFLPDEDPDGYIPDGTLCTLLRWDLQHEASAQPSSPTSSSKDVFWELRYLGLKVLVKAKHCQLLQRPTLETESYTRDAFAKEVLGLHPKMSGYEIEAVNYLHAGSLSPSVATATAKVEGKMTMIIAWQGTQLDRRPLDVCTDLAAAPVRCSVWYHLCPQLWVHSAISAKVHSDLLAHQETILTAIRAKKIERVVFTGHSLGGGAALVAHMMAMAIATDLTDQDLQDLEVLSIAFAAPMVFFQQEEGARGAKCKVTFESIIQRFQENSVNFVCGADLVPRLPGNPEYYRPAMRAALKSAVDFVATHKVGLLEGGVLVQKISSMADALTNYFVESSGIEGTFAELKQYRHLSRLLYVKLAENSLQVSDFHSSFDDKDADNFKYFLACHSFFPERIKYNPGRGGYHP